MEDGFNLLGAIIIIFIIIFLYMLPSFLYKGHKKTVFVLLNIFLGGTGVIWLVLLILALLSKKDND